MVRSLKEEDLKDVLEIQKENFNHGSLDDLKKCYKDKNYSSLVLDIGGKVVGYIILLVVDDLAEIIEIAIKDGYKGNGYSKLILSEAINKAKMLNKTGMHLEVRASNNLARGLYNKFNFTEIYVRKNYYDGKEDGIIMQLKL